MILDECIEFVFLHPICGSTQVERIQRRPRYPTNVGHGDRCDGAERERVPFPQTLRPKLLRNVHPTDVGRGQVPL